jgi:SAM-dependent methyltransferase
MSEYEFLFSKCYPDLVREREHFPRQIALLEQLFGRYGISKNSRILDAACGTGDVAMGLFDRGYVGIAGLDGSKDMLDQLRERFGSKIRIDLWDWVEVQKYFDSTEHFDFVYILGNSISHLDRALFPRVLKSIHDGLKPSGKLVLDMRRWDRDSLGQLTQKGREPQQYHMHIDGVEHLVDERFSYDYVKSCQMVSYEFYKVGDKMSTSKTSLTYSLFDQTEICQWLKDAGFAESEVDPIQRSTWSYMVIVSMKGQTGS